MITFIIAIAVASFLQCRLQSLDTRGTYKHIEWIKVKRTKRKRNGMFINYHKRHKFYNIIDCEWSKCFYYDIMCSVVVCKL